LINNYKHIIWDWNGTLLNDVYYCNKIINKILIENKLPELSLERYREIFTFPVQNYYKAAGLNFKKTSFEVLGKEFMIDYELNKLECTLYDNAEKILSEIHNRGLKQSVLSAYKEDSLIGILKSYKLFDYFDHIVGSDNIYAGSKKNQGLKLIEMLDVDKNEILFVGDTVHDYEVANAVGVNCVLIADGHQSKHKLTINGVPVFDNMNDFSKFLFN
jgi:phosphoglycolate phosphatase